MLKKDNYLERTLEFHRIYNEKVLPILRKFEPKRKKDLRKYRILMTIYGIIWLVSIKFLNPFILIALLIFTALIIGNAMYLQMDFAKNLKTACLPEILKVFSDMEWSLNEVKIPKLDLLASKLFPPCLSVKTDDAFKGSYKDVDFAIEEMRLYSDSSMNGNKYYKSSNFKGVVISFKFNKTVTNRTTIFSKEKNIKQIFIYMIFLAFIIIAVKIIDVINFDIIYQNPVVLLFCFILLGAIFITLTPLYKLLTYKPKNFNEVTLEDPVFNKKYDVYSSDQVEARYLITPTFIERFQNIKTAFGVKNIKCSFYANSLMIAIPTRKNVFEIGSLFKSLEDPSSINQFYNELSSIYGMIDCLKLYEKTGI